MRIKTNTNISMNENIDAPTASPIQPPTLAATKQKWFVDITLKS